MAYYKDLQEYLEALEKRGKLLKIKNETNKDTEMHPLMRLQFRGLPEKERKGFLFESVVDSKRRKYDIPVACCVTAGSREIYAIGMMCNPDEIGAKWAEAQMHPIEPKLVAKGPVQEEKHVGDTLLEHGGLDEFPIPISTPGYDVGPFITSPYWVTKDPENGIRNVGTYRAHVKSPSRTGIFISSPTQGAAVHWRKCKALGRPLEAAIIVGSAPNIGYASVSKLPADVDEFAVAGGIAGEPVELVKCQTVDLEVPAYAEVVIEGELSIDESEPEGPFGEATGYMGQREMMPYFDVKCITHRNNPIWQAFLSQYAPSESSKIKAIAWENNIYTHLRYNLKMSDVLAVANHADFGSSRFLVIQMKKTETSDVWQALESVVEYWPTTAKVIIAVDEDINPWDADNVNWAITYRVQPHRDIRFHSMLATTLMDYSIAPLGTALTKDLKYERMPESSLLLIDATMKWPYPPVSLPKKEFMKEALQLWQREGLPPLELKEPWWGYDLGYWSHEEEARMATKGQYYEVGEKLMKQRKPC